MLAFRAFGSLTVLLYGGFVLYLALPRYTRERCLRDVLEFAWAKAGGGVKE